MLVPPEFRLNKHTEVRIPSNKEFFVRHGSAVTPTSQYTGDDVAPLPKSKIDTLADMEEYDKMKQREEDSKKQ